ncbi:hypothetical protein GE09DRAFT_978463 [Coniochaeta sp. 2T2.1]|nr:hypothetical protein GE09DRAFT_978463 [Coniochaeta sp. 2T2.1]
MEADTSTSTSEQQAWYLKSKFPVFWPECEALTLPEEEFQAYLTRIKENGLRGVIKSKESKETEDEAAAGAEPGKTDDDTFTLISEQPSTTADVRQMLGAMEQDPAGNANNNDHPFMKGLLEHEEKQKKADLSHLTMDGVMLTENGDKAFRSTNSPLVDLFYELEEVVSGPLLRELLDQAWNTDADTTLKLIFNARSIHLGKSSRHIFYRCAGWLAQNHPLTLASNLQWLSRPVIQKKVPKKSDNDEDEMVVIEPEKDDSDPSRFDVRHGVAHGYWKDLLNILALSANGDLNVIANPRDILNIENETAGPRRSKDHKREQEKLRHEVAVEAFTNYVSHHVLHLTIARLFASQLQADLALLQSADEKVKSTISLCAKWAPSLERFHDKHTFIATSIAELMFPASHFPPLLISNSRDLYLRHAREEYRRSLSKLRTQLDIVEKHITTSSFSSISYPTVPSLAMRQYAPLFAEKDSARFTEYLLSVKSGSSQISGAVLLPSVLVRDALGRTSAAKAKARTNRTARLGVASVEGLVLDAQWDTLVKRIKESGTLDSCIAVCDVSGSMQGPQFPDGTTPMHTAIGLSLLMAEVVSPPFGGAFITFSARPTVERVDLTKTLREKIEQLHRASWDMNTDLVAVFEDLILPMAMANDLPQEQMVKRIFVFSDIQFDAATTPYSYSYSSRSIAGQKSWSSSYERIATKYAAAGYEMPEIVFWNLAGGRAGYTGVGDAIAPKPVGEEETRGVAMVSGYSQGLLKVFMDKGLFEEEEEVVETVEEGEDGVKVVKKQEGLTPEALMRRAIGHGAYAMLRVVD